MSTIAENVGAVRARMAEAAKRAGRDPAAVLLVAVSKTKGAAEVLAAEAAGCRDFGENYAQELVEKATALEALAPGGERRWHFIGQLQRNKMRAIAGKVSLFHGVDRASLADEIGMRCAALGVRADVLVQVNVAGEAQKGGCEPAAIRELLAHIERSPSLRLRGLMTMPPADSAEEARPWFRALRELRDRHGATERLPELSMGMSHDFEIAIEEGATLVRVGSAIFGERR